MAKKGAKLLGHRSVKGKMQQTNSKQKRAHSGKFAKLKKHNRKMKISKEALKRASTDLKDKRDQTLAKKLRRAALSPEPPLPDQREAAVGVASAAKAVAGLAKQAADDANIARATAQAMMEKAAAREKQLSAMQKSLKDN